MHAQIEDISQSDLATERECQLRAGSAGKGLNETSGPQFVASRSVKPMFLFFFTPTVETAVTLSLLNLPINFQS